MSESTWQYNSRYKQFTCTASGNDYPVSAKEDCFCIWYHHLAGQTWATMDVLREFYEVAVEKAPAEWMVPDRSFRASDARLSQCEHCHAIVLLHKLDTCRYCGTEQPEHVRIRVTREEIFGRRFKEFIDVIAPAPSSGPHVISASAMQQATEEAEQSMERDGIPRLARH